MSTCQPYPQAPTVAARRPRTADIVATSLLISLHVTAFVVAAFFSAFYAMASDPCGTGVACDTAKIGHAYVLTDIVGGVVMLGASAGAVLLMLRRRVAFWVPLLGITVQVILVIASIGLLGSVVR